MLGLGFLWATEGKRILAPKSLWEPACSYKFSWKKFFLHQSHSQDRQDSLRALFVDFFSPVLSFAKGHFPGTLIFLLESLINPQISLCPHPWPIKTEAPGHQESADLPAAAASFSTGWWCGFILIIFELRVSFTSLPTQTRIKRAVHSCMRVCVC